MLFHEYKVLNLPVNNLTGLDNRVSKSCGEDFPEGDGVSGIHERGV